MKKNGFIIILFFLYLSSSAKQLDSVEYYLYIDTNLMEKHLHQLQLPQKEKHWLRNLYCFNYYAIRKDYQAIHRLYMSLTFDSIYIKKYYEKWIATRFWYYSIFNYRDSMSILFKKVFFTPSFSKHLKVNILNIYSFYFANYNLLLASKCLNIAIMHGLNDSLPELYRTFLNLSAIYFSLNFPEEGKKMLERGKKFRKRNFNPILDYLYQYNAAIYFTFTKEYDKAIDVHRQMNYIFKKYQIHEYHAGSVINLSRHYIFKNQFDSAYKVLADNHSYILANKQKLSPFFWSRYYWLFSDVYKNERQYDSATFYLQKAIQLAEQYQFIEATAELYSDYASLLKSKNISEAYTNLEKAFHYKDILTRNIYVKFTDENTHKIKLLENSIKLNQYQNSLLEAKYIYQQQINRNRYILIFSILFIISIILFLRNIYLRRINKLKQQHTKEILVQHEKTLQNISHELHDNIAHSLNILKQKIVSKEELADLNKIINEIRELSHLSYPSYLLHLPFSDTLNAMFHKIETSTQHTILAQFDPKIDEIPNNTKIHLYRIIQELLNNTINNNTKTTIKIKIEHQTNYFIMNYEDFNFETKEKKIIKGFGLNSIQQRCQIINAKYKYYFNNGFKFILKFENV